MGTFLEVDGGAPVHTFYSAASWIEGAATHQLVQVAQMPGIRAVAAMPDLHPGKYGPVGCAILAEQILPRFVGSDIGCGMGLFQLNLAVRKLRVDRAAERLESLEDARARGLNGDCPEDVPSALADTGLQSTSFDGSLGTIGGGNHFCELQAIEDVHDVDAAAQAGFDESRVFALVHSGSRGFGHAILQSLLESGQDSFDVGGDGATTYLDTHDEAVRWAQANRRLIAERAARALRTDAEAIVDQPHNFLEQTPGGVLHRKGAAPADRGLVPVPGSRGTLSYLVKPTGARSEALASLAHGAGRKYDRGSMHGRIRTSKADRANLERNPFGGRIVCTSRDLLVEEAPDAYKSIDRVIDDLVSQGLATVVASFRPLVTYKTARPERRARAADKRSAR
ncbi:MAG: RNA ligase RtcB family protein [Pseudomonadota bacterium]